MDNQPNQNRIKNIYQMLFEMATGNLDFRLLHTGKDDELDRMATALNTVASELRTAILKTGYVNPYYRYQNVVQAIITIDRNFRVTGCNAGAIEMLGYHPNAFLRQDFCQMLTKHSQLFWEAGKNEIRDNKNFHATMHLVFRVKNKKVIPLFCTVSRLDNSNTIIISSITTVLQELLFDNVLPASITRPKKSASVLAQEVYEYILDNLEEPLPSTTELSKIFGTNEYTLKESFRHFFNTGIYKFYTEERLRKAHNLIEQTAIPIKEIAFMSGFNDYANFSKAFKRKYYYSPSDLQRCTEEKPSEGL